jgi:hypothetical protein
MTVEASQLRTRDGRFVEAQAEVVRYGTAARILRGGGTVFGFTAVGLMTIVVPGVHLVLPWLLPLIGLGLGAYIGRVTMKVGEVRGTCPDCAAEMVIGKSGAVARDEALWLRCPACTLPMELMKDRP